MLVNARKAVLVPSEHVVRTVRTVQTVRGSGGWLVLAMGASVPLGSTHLVGRGRPRGLPGLQLARNAKQKRLSTFAPSRLDLTTIS